MLLAAIKNSLKNTLYILGIHRSQFVVVTTMHKDGYLKYGRKMISTFDKYWPWNIELHVYAEDFAPESTQLSKRIVFFNLHDQIPELLNFKRRNDNLQKKILFQHKSSGPAEQLYKWEAIRFSNKVYATYNTFKYHLSRSTKYLIWLDADVSTFEIIPNEFLYTLTKPNTILSYLGRNHMHSECGFIIYNLSHPHTQSFLNRFYEYYQSDMVFNENELHDSYIFDQVRKEFESNKHGFFNLSSMEYDIANSNHPFINSPLGGYMDHFKGKRKEQGHSRLKDLNINRTESYWKSLRRNTEK